MRIWQCTIAFLFCSSFTLPGHSGVPLTTQFVKCIEDDKGIAVAARTVQSPIIVSKNGRRAFGKVVAKVERGCHNTSTIYVSERHQSFHVVFEQKTEVQNDGTVLDGNGVEALVWSPSGDNLLIKISQWVWGSDADTPTKYLIYHADKPVRVVEPIDAVWKTFERPCSALVESRGWIDNSQIELIAKPFVSTDEEGIPDGTPLCLKKPMRFSFDVEKGNLAQLPDTKEY